MIRTLLVDDEVNSRIVLRSLLSTYCEDCEVIGEAGNVEEAYEAAISLNPDLVFLDIQMPREDGFGLLKRFEEVPFQVIFATSFDRYAIDAIRFSALDYLLKPVDPEHLVNAIARARKRIGHDKNENQPLIDNVFNNLNDTLPKKIAVHENDKVKLISEEEIVSIVGSGSYSNVITTDGRKYTLSKYLKELETLFGDQSKFIRISRSAILNAAQIKSYTKGDPCSIEMKNGEVHEVSRRKKTEVLALLKIAVKN